MFYDRWYLWVHYTLIHHAPGQVVTCEGSAVYILSGSCICHCHLPFCHCAIVTHVKYQTKMNLYSYFKPLLHSDEDSTLSIQPGLDESACDSVNLTEDLPSYLIYRVYMFINHLLSIITHNISFLVLKACIVYSHCIIAILCSVIT